MPASPKIPNSVFDKKQAGGGASSRGGGGAGSGGGGMSLYRYSMMALIIALLMVLSYMHGAATCATASLTSASSSSLASSSSNSVASSAKRRKVSTGGAAISPEEHQFSRREKLAKGGGGGAAAAVVAEEQESQLDDAKPQQQKEKERKASIKVDTDDVPESPLSEDAEKKSNEGVAKKKAVTSENGGGASVPETAYTEEEMKAFDADIETGPKFLQSAWTAVKAGRESPEDEGVIPVFTVPLFHDAQELTALLQTIDVPVRLFVFAWNSESREMKDVLDILRRIPFGLHIHHHPENIGFSGAVNCGLHDGRANLTNPEARWFFIVNADAAFPAGNLRKFAKQINNNKLYESDGLVYGPRQDHFAFVITKAAVDAVGFMDETFYPGYMEDIDFHWRVGLAGLNQTITKIFFEHKRSVNLKKPGTGNYKQMLMRSASNWEYAWQKWGDFAPARAADIEARVPLNGWKTPFNIPGAPLSLWKVDPEHRQCIRTGQGQTHLRSKTCWFNGTVLYSSPDFPSDEKLTRNLLQPMQSGALSKIMKQSGALANRRMNK